MKSYAKNQAQFKRAEKERGGSPTNKPVTGYLLRQQAAKVSAKRKQKLSARRMVTKFA